MITLALSKGRIFDDILPLLKAAVAPGESERAVCGAADFFDFSTHPSHNNTNHKQ